MSKGETAQALDALAKEFNRLDTTAVSDALDKLGINGGCYGITPRNQGLRVAGRAFTVRYRPCGVVKGTVGDFLDDVEPGQVIVIDNGARTYGTVWGDIMTVYSQKRGIAGTVIDGVCRDLPKIHEVRYPIYSRGHFMVTGKDRVELDGVNIPVSISDVQVRCNDIVVADDTGVVVIPFERAEEVLKIAVEVDEAEQKILKLLDQGLTLRDARKQMGYHKLQSKS